MNHLYSLLYSLLYRLLYRLRTTLATRAKRLRATLSLDGRLRVRQPLALAPGPLLLLAALAFPFRWLFFLAYAWLLTAALCYLWLRHLAPRIQLTRRLESAWAEVGDDLVEDWALVNSARLPLLWLELDDQSTVPGYSARRVMAAGPEETRAWRTAARCTRRGVYLLGPLTARCADPLGIFEACWQIGQARRIIVYPALARLPELPLPFGQSGGLARADLLQQAATPSVGGLREYVPGDQTSHIHWPTVARTRRLMVKEFDQERAGALWIALDLYAPAYRTLPEAQPAPGADPAHTTRYGQSSIVADGVDAAQPENLLELAIVLAGSLAAHALSQGRSVGFLAQDAIQHIVAPGQGQQQLWRILGALVNAQAEGDCPAATLIAPDSSRLITRSRGAAIVLITPQLNGAWITELSRWQTRSSAGALALLVAAPGQNVDDLAARLATIGVRMGLFRLGDHLPPLHPTRPRTIARVSPLGRIQTTQL